MEASRDPEVLWAGELEIRPADWLALAGGRPLALSVKELQLLVALARHGGRVLPRDEIHRLVWGGALRAGDRSVDVYIAKLRHKLAETLPDWSFIHTHFGLGYRFSPELSQPVHTTATRRQQAALEPLEASDPHSAIKEINP
jgi:DNA-binding response OmpR family regulator